jgi:hypothetical protein
MSDAKSSEIAETQITCMIALSRLKTIKLAHWRLLDSEIGEVAGLVYTSIVLMIFTVI